MNVSPRDEYFRCPSRHNEVLGATTAVLLSTATGGKNLAPSLLGHNLNVVYFSYSIAVPKR